jgi:hypothetical protein
MGTFACVECDILIDWEESGLARLRETWISWDLDSGSHLSPAFSYLSLAASILCGQFTPLLLSPCEVRMTSGAMTVERLH